MRLSDDPLDLSPDTPGPSVVDQPGAITLGWTDLDTGLPHLHTFPFEAIAAYAELLGIDDPGETCQAMMQIHQAPPAPGPDGLTPLAPAFEVLAEGPPQVVQAREERRAAREGTAADPRSPRLRGLLAAATRRTRITDAQARTRRDLGIPDPGKGTGRAFDAVRTPAVQAAIAAHRAAFVAKITTPPEEGPQ